MRAVVEQQHGAPEVLEVTEIPDPRPGPQEVLIRVAAAGLNRADAVQRKGHYPPPPGAPSTYGLEVSGTVLEVGEEAARATSLEPGRPVVALLAGGGYAERVAVHHAQVLPAPDGVELVDAAALPEVAATVWANLFTVAGLDPAGPSRPGEAVLAHGGSGGIGAHAIQLCRALGYRVFTTVGSAEKARWVEELVRRQDERIAGLGRREPGEVVVVRYREEDFAEVVRERTGGEGVRAILDVVGGSYLEPNVKALGTEGRLVVIAVQGGRTGELDLSRLMSKRAWVGGTTLRSRSAQEKGEILAGMAATVWPLLSEGVIDPLVDRRFPLDQVRGAHEYFDSGEHRGKVLLTL